ncbi:MAG: exodeoxyribonuclease VII small subunit [Campylobacteraceae bacterium]|nr:exodeoxyribonuclease VII small subunit [Campylobacteraceae bacterium]
MAEELAENLEQISFEEKLKKLDSLLEKLKDENLSLDKSVEVYKVANSLLKECKTDLEKAKLEVIEMDNE